MSTPAIGFGTAPVLGRLGKRDSLLAMKCAYELGVRHFDTARSYGWGEAESVLASFLSQHPRASYTLVSKCGIVPVRRSRLMSVAKAVARQVLQRLPASRSVVRGIASSPAFQPTTTYDLRILRESFETSLRELGTHYLDLLLLHNFKPGKKGLKEVVNWLRELQQQGKILRFGYSVEGGLHAGMTYLAQQGLLFDAVIQTPISRQLLTLPEQWRGQSFIAHSPFRYLGSETRAGEPRQGLEGVFAAVAAACNCAAIVCSMFTRDHIEANVRAHAAIRARETASSNSVADSR